MAEPKYTYEEVVQALRNADAAGDTQAATRLAQIADSMVAKPSPASQFATGVGKRAQEVAQALRGVGLRAGELTGMVSPEDLAAYEQEVAASRSVMSPQYRQFKPQTVSEYLGGLGLDLATMAGAGGALKLAEPVAAAIPRVGQAIESGLRYGRQALIAPKSIPQAGLGGALYAQTIPFATGEEAARATGTSAVIGGALQPALRAVGLATPTETQLQPAQIQAARRGVEAGFQFTPSQMTGSKTGMFIEEGIKALPLARGAFTKLEDANQQSIQDIAARSIGLKAGVPFTAQSMESAYNNALQKYQAIQSVPSIKLDKAFGQQVDTIINQLKKVPESQRSQLGVPEIVKVLEDYKGFTKNAVDGETMFLGLKAIGDQLFEAQKQGRIGAGAYKDLRSALENAIERSISQPSKKNLVSQDVIQKFKDGRTQLSNWFTINEAFNAATGEISGAKLAGSLARKSNFGGRNTELETAALAARAIPRALPSSGTAERAESASLVRQLAAAGTLPVLGGGAAGLYTQDPYAALIGAGASQVLPAIAARIATSEPVRSIVARRQLGAVAPDEGILAGAFRGLETNVPASLRFGAGDLARIAAQQQAIRGLLD